MTTRQLVDYYATLLILQYLGKPNAAATVKALAQMAVMPQVSVQTISFSPAPTTGTWKLNYNGVNTGTLNWNDTAVTIQAALQAISGLGSVTVSGSIAAGLTITFTGVTPPAYVLTVSLNSLLATSTPVVITIAETDVTLPIAVQNAFDPLTAVGNQLDVIGKYQGVSRIGNTLSGPVTLSDADFRTLIKLATVKNNAGSSLNDIQSLIALFFAGKMLVYDYQNMQMSYLINTSAGSLEMVEVAILNNLIPKPMAVAVSAVIYVPNITTLFGFRTYLLPAMNVSPFNSYSSYQTDRPWLSYSNAVIV